MGQNGAGKSTLFKLINGGLQKISGVINIDQKATIATSYQVVLPEDKELTVDQFFRKYHPDKTQFSIEKDIKEILEVVNLKAAFDKQIKAFS
jgi:ABC-type multidrug transport system ATPase subunit